MKQVDDVIAAVAASGVQCNALTDALLLPTSADMSAAGELLSSRRPQTLAHDR